MTEKRYTYSELNNCQYAVMYTTFEEIYGEENIFHNRICVVNTKKQAQKVVDLLNENEQLKKENKHLRCTIESNSQDDYIDYLEKQNERLKERITELATNDKIVFINE